MELKVENERLQKHLNVLRAHSQQLSATQSAQHMGPYAGDDLSAQMATSLPLPSRSTQGRDLSRQHYSTSHGYEAGASGAFPTVSSLEDDGDTEPRKKKVKRLTTRAHVTVSPDILSSPKSHSVVTSIFAIRAAARIPQNGERYARHLDLFSLLFDWLLTSLGCRVPMALKLFAMPVASDGQRRCANMRRPPRQATRISFLSTISYPLSLVATTPPVFYMGHFLHTSVYRTTTISPWPWCDSCVVYMENMDIEQQAQR